MLNFFILFLVWMMIGIVVVNVVFYVNRVFIEKQAERVRRGAYIGWLFWGGLLWPLFLIFTIFIFIGDYLYKSGIFKRVSDWWNGEVEV